jgi:succinate-acetate transporter protein
VGVRQKRHLRRVALSSYGGFWISFYLLQHTFLEQIPAGDRAGALALYLVAWAVFSLYMWIGSMRVSLAVQAVFLTLWPAYLLLGLGQALDSSLLFHLGGILGIATAACAWYTSGAARRRAPRRPAGRPPRRQRRRRRLAVFHDHVGKDRRGARR